MEITDLTGTKWLLNETITKAPAGWILDSLDGGIDDYYINFISDSVEYDYISFLSDGFIGGGAIGYGRDEYGKNFVYSYSWDNGGSSSPYRTIEITGGTDVTNATLINWLETNATQIIEPPVSTKTKVDNKLNVVIGTKTQITGDTEIPENAILIVTDEELKADEIAYSDEKTVKEVIEDLEEIIGNIDDILDSILGV